jgi:DNA-binding Xre family transcriptional regulator
MIKLLIEERLKELGKSKYWLIKETGIPKSTLYRYTQNCKLDEEGHLVYETSSIKLNHLGKLHLALESDPGELIVIGKNGNTTLAIKKILERMQKSILWLSEAQNTDIVALWKLATNQRNGIYFDTLEKLYRTLKCRRSELIQIIEEAQTNGNGHSECA